MAKIPARTDHRSTSRSSAVLRNDTLVLDFNGTSDVTDASGHCVGRTEQAAGGRLVAVELNGRPVLEVGTREVGWKVQRAVSGPGGVFLGHVMGNFGGRVDEGSECKALLKGLVNLRVVAGASSREVARMRRQPLRPNWPNNVVTRFCSPRYRIDFATTDPRIRCLVIALTFVHHSTRLDD